MGLKATEWAAEVARRVGRRTERFRTNGPEGKGPKLSAQAVADRCTDLGLPVDRAVIAKLEKGFRQTLTIGELMVLAKALEVPPVVLLFPLGDEEATEVLPGRTVPTWEAVKWFSGRDASPQADWRESSVPTQLWEEHDDAVSAWEAAPEHMLKSQSYGVPPADAERNFQTSRKISEGNLRRIRGRIRSLGLTPPPLPTELESLDETDEHGRPLRDG